MDVSRHCTFVALALTAAGAVALSPPAHAFLWMLDASGEPVGSGDALIVGQSPTPTPAESTKSLAALVISVTGIGEWRASEDVPYQTARVDDVLPQGAQIRTGRAPSSIALRVGKNATIIVDSISSVILPEIVQDGSVLRTRAALKHGKADFKVDQAGFANDFEVVTPSSVISVRGTGFRVAWGAFDGTHVSSFDGNRMRAVEMSYFGRPNRFFLDPKGRSTDRRPDPAVLALLGTVGPPPMGGTAAETAASEQLADMGVLPDRFAGDVQSVQQSPNAGDYFNAFASAQQRADYFASLVPPPTNTVPNPVFNPPGGGGGRGPIPGPPRPGPAPHLGQNPLQTGAATSPYFTNTHTPPVIVTPPQLGGKR